MTTNNTKKPDRFSNTSWMVISKKPNWRPKKCGACNQIGHHRNYRILPMKEKWIIMIPNITLKLYLELQLQGYSLTLNGVVVGCSLKFLPHIVNVNVFHVKWRVQMIFGNVMLLPVPIFLKNVCSIKASGS